MGRPRSTWRHLATLPLDSILAPGEDPGAPLSPEEERLATAMERQGMRDPVLVVEEPGNGHYRLLAGAKRLRAARYLGWSTLHCLLLPPHLTREAEALAAFRQGAHDPWELAHTLATLQKEPGWSQAQLGTLLGRGRDFITALLVLTRITPAARQEIESGGGQGAFSQRHLRYVGRTAPARQVAAVHKILAEGLSSKALEREQHRRAPRAPRQLIKLRGMPAPGKKGTASQGARLSNRRRYRQLLNDLARVDRVEAQEDAKAQAMMDRARARRQQVATEAREKRKALKSELRRVKRILEAK